MGSSDEEADAPICRICHDPAPPLDTPCGCRGTAAYVHAECQLRWIRTSGQLSCSTCKQRVVFSDMTRARLAGLVYGRRARRGCMCVSKVLLIFMTWTVMSALFINLCSLYVAFTSFHVGYDKGTWEDKDGRTFVWSDYSPYAGPGFENREFVCGNATALALFRKRDAPAYPAGTAIGRAERMHFGAIMDPGDYGKLHPDSWHFISRKFEWLVRARLQAYVQCAGSPLYHESRHKQKNALVHYRMQPCNPVAAVSQEHLPVLCAAHGAAYAMGSILADVDSVLRARVLEMLYAVVWYNASVWMVYMLLPDSYTARAMLCAQGVNVGMDMAKIAWELAGLDAAVDWLVAAAEAGIQKFAIAGQIFAASMPNVFGRVASVLGTIFWTVWNVWDTMMNNVVELVDATRDLLDPLLPPRTRAL